MALGPREVVAKLRDLAEITDHRPVIARDERCLGGLIQFVSHSDTEVALSALEALKLLASHPSNRVYLMQHAELTTALDKVLRNPSTPQSLQIAAQCVIRTMRSQEPDSKTAALHERSSASTSNSSSSSSMLKKQAYEVYIPEMTSQARRDTVQKALLAMQGMISVTINPLTQRAAIMATCALDAIEKVIQAAGMTALRPGAESDKENASAAAAGPKAVTTQELLDAEARKERQRREELKEKARSTSFFSRIGRALYLV